MIDAQDTTPNDAGDWLELANGGGLVHRDPAIAAPSKPQYTRHRQPKRLETFGAMARAKDP